MNAGYKLHEIRKLSFRDINLICEAYYDSLKPQWEQARFIAYVQAQVNNRKKLKPRDILPFAWDDAEVSDIMSREDIENIKNEYVDMLSQ